MFWTERLAMETTTSMDIRKEELKHDLNELCIYVHMLFGYCEGA